MSPLRKLILKTSVAALLVAGASALAEQLSWGPAGAGGNGTWDTTTANWWNGSSNVQWISGSTAIFGGAGGSVGTIFSGLVVGGMTFNSPGYVLPSDNAGWLHITGDMIVTANTDATLAMTMSANTGTAGLVKEGAATLTVTGTNFLDRLQVNAGTYRTSDLFFSDVTLANAPGVTVSMIGSSGSLGSLSGGGAAGGVVQPDSTTAPFSLLIDGSGSFAGLLRDNAAAGLSVQYFGGSTGTQTLTAANPYTGGTTVSSGRLVLSGAGSIASSASLSVSTGGTLSLDNSTTPLSNRVAAGVPVTLSGGKFELLGHASTAVSESIGALTFSGPAAIVASQPSAASTTLTLASLSRSAGATLDISGSGRVIITAATLNAGIISPFVTSGNEYVTLDANNAVVPFSAYAALNSGAASDNVKVSGAGVMTLGNSGARNTLNLQNTDAAPLDLELGGNTLTLAGGSLLTSGSGAMSLRGGTLTSGSSELMLITRGNTTIDAILANGAGAMSLVKQGTGTLSLLGANTYTGDTTIVGGTLAIASDQSLGVGGKLIFSGGKLQLLADVSTARAFGTSQASFDTNGFTLTLNAAIPTSIVKSGAGTLVLPNLAGSVTVQGGALTVRAATSGSVSMADGTTLDATGRLTKISPIGTGTLRLEIAAGRAATLLLDTPTSTFGNSQKLKLGFDLGSAGSDLLYLGTAAGSGGSSFNYTFDFNDLGGAQTGQDYPLMSFSTSTTSGRPTLSQLSIAPEALAEGWRGTFKVTTDQVVVNLTAVPEPATSAFLVGGAALLAARRRR